MTLTATEKTYIWLNSFPLTEGEKRKLLLAAKEPTQLLRNFSSFRAEMINFGKESVYNNMQSTLSDGGKYFTTLISRMEKAGVTPISVGSPDYPKEFSKLPDAPLALYAKGDISLLKTQKITVVGSRSTPVSAIKTGRNIAQQLAARFTVVTGTADGGDGAAIEGGLQGGRVIAVAAGGLDQLPQGNGALLKEVANKGLLLSPYPLGTPVRAFSYEYRNKLLAALGEGTLVLGAGEKSGALVTARYAKEYQKKRFALPYSPGSFAGQGCNALIKDGATLTESAEDIFAAFGVKTPTERKKTTLTAEEEGVLSLLQRLGEAHATQLSEQSHLPVYKLTAVLSSLEIKGLATKLGGNRYAPL